MSVASKVDAVHRALVVFADDVHAKLGLAGSPKVWPEDQLKSPVSVLFQALAKIYGKVGVVNTEAPRSAEDDDGGSRVDAVVRIGPTLATVVPTGHIELKAPSKSGDPRKLTDMSDKAQWKKFQRLPNLIYTNGREWTLQRTGIQIGALVRFSGDPVALGGAAVTREDAERFEALAAIFLSWDPIVPKTSRQIAELLAPLCALLRTEALEALKRPNSALTKLAAEMRKYLFPEASNEVVADAYAQTFTYALLIARFEGAEPLTFASAEGALSRGHGLLSEVLGLLDSPRARREVETSTDMLVRVIGQIIPSAITARDGDNPWLYFYEEFLAAYDPALRKKVGAYYTPVEVVHAQVSFVRDLLRTRFGKEDAFADDGVVTLDPAVGTGTYPLGILRSVIDSVPSHLAGSRPDLLRRAVENLYGIEYLIGPYSVAHLRLSRFLADNGVTTDEERPLNILLADTLASHETNGEAMLSGVFGYEQIEREREIARELKVDTRVVVCMGNPPYLRGRKAEGGASIGGWVTLRRAPGPGQKVRDPITRRMVKDTGEIGIIRDFTAPVIAEGRGGDLKNLYNAYVYFWRWALWKVFEQEIPAPSEAFPVQSGIISFITASSYLRGPAFTGMRRHMREVLDEIWIVDLGGDNKGGRRTENVFAIETPVAILTGVRYGTPNPSTPAKVHYVSLADMTATEKRSRLDSMSGLDDPSLDWLDGMEAWEAPLLPAADETYLSWPAVTDLFPWQVSGPQLKRSWPIGESPELLRNRWARLTQPLPLDRVTGKSSVDKAARTAIRGGLFGETRDRKVAPARGTRKGSPTGYPHLFTGDPQTDIAELELGTAVEIRPYGFRALDRQYVMADSRVGDFMRPSLWRAHSDDQRYLTSMLTEVIGRGPAAVAARDVPDLHHFRGSFGGRHVIPLWKDAAASQPNVTKGVLERLQVEAGIDASPSDLFSYAYGLLASSTYVDRFWDALTVPGPRLPITKDRELFEEVRSRGERMLWLHTEALHDPKLVRTPTPGVARFTRAVPADQYPEAFSYDPVAGTLKVGEGNYSDVSPEVWNYSVSGFRVVESWLSYRMKSRSGKGNGQVPGSGVTADPPV
ncbi:MAG: hypothetical protein K2X36_11545 [Microbacteriaceae bacterium]|nr:hypothetical protein [Microbacteriaceae bacterium]